MGDALIDNSEYGRRDRHHFLYSRDGGLHRREDGGRHAYHALDSGDHRYCEREDLLSHQDHFPDHRKIFSGLQTMAFVSHPKVPDTEAMVKMTKTMVEDDREVSDLRQSRRLEL
jgi:hypothetical protein